MRAGSQVIASVVALALASAAFAAIGGGTAHHRSASSKPGLKVSGHIDGLYPGAVKPLPVKLKSNYPFPIRVRSVRARISDGGFGCPKEKLAVTRWTGLLRVRPHSSRHIALQAALSPSALNACQGAVFPLRFKARATP
jgi:hypothetical protein